MARITGRPKKAVKQEKFRGFFVTQVQDLVIVSKAKEAGVNMSDYLRQAAVHARVITRWKQEEMEIFHKMVGMANGINEVVKIARREGSLPTVLYFEKYRGILDSVIERLERIPQ